MTPKLLLLLASTTLAAPSMAQSTQPAQTQTPAALATNQPAIPAEQPAAAKPEKWQDRVSLTLGNDFTNAYFFRGIRQEDNGFITQPYASLSIAAVKTDDLTLNLNFTNWNSFHDNRTNASPNRGSFMQAWYEADYVAGASLVVGNWTAGLTYTWLDSPSGGFKDQEELAISGAFNDTEALGPWSLKPSLTVVFETSGGAADGQDRGIYAQLALTPGTDLDLSENTKLRLDLPVILGTSLSDYYQNADGGNDFFGFLAVGPKLTIPLPLPAGFGAWSISTSATYLLMGDNARDFNAGDSAEWIFAAGFAVSF